MEYFSGIQWMSAMHVPRCGVWLPRWRAGLYALNFARAGRIRLAVGRRRQVTLNAPVAWWTWPGQTFHYGCLPGETWDHAFVSFTGERVQRWIEAGLFTVEPTRAYVAIQDAAVFAERMDELVRRFRDPVRRDDWMVSLLESLLLLCAEERRVEAGGPHDVFLQRLVRAIHRQPGAPWDWNTEARRAGVSAGHLRRLFTAHCGLPPNQYLIQARMREAADRLRQTPQAIKQIGAAVGYDNVYYFTKLFTDRYGLAPGRYRAASRQLAMTGA
jgi:AraC-like DNA-binding protein